MCEQQTMLCRESVQHRLGKASARSIIVLLKKRALVANWGRQPHVLFYIGEDSIIAASSLGPALPFGRHPPIHPPTLDAASIAPSRAADIDHIGADLGTARYAAGTSAQLFRPHGRKRGHHGLAKVLSESIVTLHALIFRACSVTIR